MNPQPDIEDRVIAVVIGRNEGDRLRKCLESVISQIPRTVYVDSGSSDGSPELAESFGALLVRIDMSTPFTPGRARNAGVKAACDADWVADFVHFVDGDCELESDWVKKAIEEMDQRPECAVVWGRLTERHPEASIYNRLCQLEWEHSTGYGDVTMSGGISLVRLSAYNQVGGFNSLILANEDGEFCYRLRKAGWSIYRSESNMAIHDANITRFRQWWRRSVRAGYAYVENAALHVSDGDWYCIRPLLSSWIWMIVLPLTIIVGGIVLTPAFFAGFVFYLLLYYRIRTSGKTKGMCDKDASIYTAFCFLGKLPQILGQFMYICRRMRGKENRLIEYK